MNRIPRWARAMARLPAFCVIAAALTCALVPSPALAADPPFPSKPVRLVIPFAPGGLTDLMARVIQPKLSERFGQTVMVDNRPGAGGVIATNYVAKSAPDGHTLYLSWDTHTINPIAMKQLPYDTFKDLLPVTLLIRLPLVMGAWGQLPADTLTDFVALAKSQPGKLNFASIGASSSSRLWAELTNSLAGIDVVHVPYNGGGAAMLALIGGEAAYGFFSYATVQSHLKSGKLKALAVTGNRRLSQLPDTPTMSEAGFPGFEAYSWVGIYAAAGTPESIINRLNREFIAVLNDPEINRRLLAMGVEIIGSTPQELDRFQRDDYRKWRDFVTKAGLQFD